MKNRYRMLMIFLTILSLSAEILTRADPAAGHWWSVLPGFYLMFGFAGCIAIILISKALGMWVLRRKEDYYDAG